MHRRATKYLLVVGLDLEADLLKFLLGRVRARNFADQLEDL
jgi:hypothetical protein